MNKHFITILVVKCRVLSHTCGVYCPYNKPSKLYHTGNVLSNIFGRNVLASTLQ